MASTRQLRITFLFALVMLIAQFLLGMAVNLFVKIPDQHPGSNPSEYFSGVAQSVTWAIRRGIVVSAVFGFIGVLGAGFNGGSFLNYHQDFSSMLMAAGFAIAVVSYSVGLYFTNDGAPTRIPA